MDHSKNKDPWNWHREGNSLQKMSNYDISQKISYVFDDDTTPVKACGDFAYNVNNTESNIIIQKEPEECRETSSQIKRRRMLQFNAQDGVNLLSDERMSLEYLKLKEREEPNEEVLAEVSQWLSGTSDYELENEAANYEDLEAADGWLAECLKDTEIQSCPDNLDFSGADNVHIDVAACATVKLCNSTPANEQNMVQYHLTQTPRKIVFKGRKSLIQTPTKVPSSVAYPFTIVKPCAGQGDITLKEINKRILSPPPSKAKQSKEEPLAYPKSAFSGKPVVGKTKIRTEGGKGSITIMRTRG